MTQHTWNGVLTIHTERPLPFMKLHRPLLKRKPSVRVDKSSQPKSITTFPVRVHKEDHQINQAALNARKNFKEFARSTEFRPHSASPYGNFFSICWPNGKTERVKLATEIIESLWIYDDVMEDVDHSSAVKVHASVRNSITGMDSLVQAQEAAAAEKASSKKTKIESLFRDFGARLNQMDKRSAPRVLASLKAYLDNYDSQKTPFTTIQKYTEYRVLNVGYGIMDSFMQWTMGLDLNEAETDEAHKFYRSAGRVMGLTNDLYSWNVERTESVDAADRKWNAVPVIMQQYELNEEDATVFLRGLIGHHEQVTRQLGQELLRRFNYSPTMTKYVEAVGLMLGGNCFWSAVCPRYNPAA